MRIGRVREHFKINRRGGELVIDVLKEITFGDADSAVAGEENDRYALSRRGAGGKNFPTSKIPLHDDAMATPVAEYPDAKNTDPNE